MVSSRGSRAVVLVPLMAVFAVFATLALGSGRALAGPDAGAADSERYAQRVASSVRSHHGEVKACYAVALERNPQLAGTFDAVWTIDTAGKPHSVHFATPPADAELGACMVRTIAAWRFEKPTEPSEVMFPFVFQTPDATRSAPATDPAAPPPAAPVTQAGDSDQRPPKGSGKTTGTRKRAPATKPALNEAPQRSKR